MQKTIHYRQVHWFGRNEDLPALIGGALAARPNSDQAVFRRDGETFEVRHRVVAQREVRLHLCAFVPGARKAVAPHVAGVPAADLADAAPPANTDFVEREIALVVRERKLGYVASGATLAKRVEAALRGIVELEHGADIANRLVLTAKADAAMIQRLLEEGVDRLDFGLSLPSAEADGVVRRQPRSIVERIGNAVAEEVLARVTEDRDAAEIDDLEQMSAMINLRLKKRKPTVGQIETLTALATDAVEATEEFSIRTANSKTLVTRDRLTIKSHFDHPETATLPYLHAWEKIAEFLNAN